MKEKVSKIESAHNIINKVIEKMKLWIKEVNHFIFGTEEKEEALKEEKMR